MPAVPTPYSPPLIAPSGVNPAVGDVIVQAAPSPWHIEAAKYNEDALTGLDVETDVGQVVMDGVGQ